MLTVDRNAVDLSRLNDNPCNTLVCLKRTTTIDVLTLVITLFGFSGYVATAFGVGGGLTSWAMHHVVLSFSNAIYLD